MSARVFAVGITIPGDAAEHIPFRSDESLFDADVVIFRPTFYDYSAHESYAGKPLVSESDSPKLVRDCGHWRSELKAAVEAGKVIFVILAKPQEFYYYTGEQTYSGTGRSRVTTQHVSSTTSYTSIPFHLEGLVPKGGSEIAVLGELGPLAVYWNEFGAESAYEVYFDSKGMEPLLGTKKREKVVGGLLRTKSGGALVFLPPVRWNESALTYMRGASTFWRKSAIALGKRLISTLVAVSDVLRREGKRTPIPQWVVAPEYSLGIEKRIQDQVNQLDQEIRILTERRGHVQKEAEKAAEVRGLLYETGKPLETAILKALQLFGFSASTYRDSQSEFDAVFTSAEGRFLGEVEGKDTRAINIDKMSQLERNLQEDFAREGVTDFAKGVLFGNAFRLDPLSQRGPFFTEKCMTAAKRLHIALVRTPDLFPPAQYLTERENETYAAECRKVIFQTDGEIVVFPEVPRIRSDGG